MMRGSLHQKKINNRHLTIQIVLVMAVKNLNLNIEVQGNQEVKKIEIEEIKPQINIGNPSLT